jgi:tetratricopeptide (TPR) repeat protein
MPQVSFQQAFNQATELYQAGRLADAASVFRQLLGYEPCHAPTLHMLGVISAQSGQLAQAERLIRDAIAADPAEANYPANLGNVLQEQGRLEEAVASFRQALALGASVAQVQSNLGNTLAMMGCREEAIAAYRIAIAAQSDFPEAHFNLANSLKEMGEIDAAVREYRRAIELRSQYAEAYINLGVALLAGDRPDEAVAVCRRAAELAPASFDARQNLGLALQRSGEHDPAIDVFRSLTAQFADSAPAYHALGNALREAGRLDEAAAAYRRAIALKPDFADSHYGLAWTLLMTGETGAGFEEYEWRTRLQEAQVHARYFTRPQWDGSSVPDQRVLLHAEQGFGDTIFAWRYVRAALPRCKEIIVQCPMPLRSLLAGQSLVSQVISDEEAPPPFDLHCPLMSLAHLLGTGGEDAASQVPYLSADPKLVEVWRERLRASRPLRVGLVWAGKPTPPDRSIPLAMFNPLARLHNVRFHSLQVGLAAMQPAPPGLELVHWSGQLTDFSHTAALIANLDLVITIDTAVAHLAGAMAKPTWVLLQFAPDWRWSIQRQTTPWYPTIRLFRQSEPGDWEGVIAQVADELSKRPIR